MAGVDVELAVGVTDDDRYGVRLDDQVPGQAVRLVGRGLRGRLVWVPDRNQVRHGVIPLCGCDSSGRV